MRNKYNCLVLVMVFAVFCVSALGSVSAADPGNATLNSTNSTGLADSPYPEYGINGNHTSQSNYTGPQNGTTKWTYSTDSVYCSAIGSI
ncbi:MAG: hypothetical protein K8E24_008890 [Methanobacterium paludis]|nr:hypothetical protein [Methanobacterium paludis]